MRADSAPLAGAEPELGADVAAFAAAVRAFLAREMGRAADYPDPSDLTGLAEPFERDLLRRAGAEGLLGSAVPAGQGGPGRGAGHQAAFDFLAAAFDAPLIDTALTLAGHPIMQFGSPRQLADFVPRMVRGEITMAVAYTEEQAGSDLRAIQSAAEPDGDGYLLRGRKVLVTGAHKADWCVTIALTGEKPGAMTMFLVDLSTPGVSVRRRPTMNGWTLDEVTFDRVRVGPDAVLGARGGAWRQLIASVQAERSGLAYLGFARHVLDLLGAYLRGARRDGAVLAADVLARDTLAELEIDFDAGLRLAARAVREPGTAAPTPMLASAVKVVATELLQRIAQAATELSGHAGTVHGPLFGGPAIPEAAANGRFAWEYLERVHATIGAGTSELLRDGIAEYGLGLPRGPR